jgi:hypothetical protein
LISKPTKQTNPITLQPALLDTTTQHHYELNELRAVVVLVQDWLAAVGTQHCNALANVG